MSKPAISILLIAFCLSVSADVRLPAIFSSGMVLQRNTDLEIWGWSDPGENVRVTFKGKNHKIKSDKNGSWSIPIGSHEAGGPFEIVVTGKNKIVLDNVLLGDVWICSGQSNMDWPLSGDYYGEKEIAEADFPNIRLFKVGKDQSQSPQPDVKGDWKVCSPETAGKFSAVGYFFGKEIHLSQNVPIGLIQASWGGSGIISWMSGNAFDQLPEYQEEMKLLESGEDYLRIKSDEYSKKLSSWFEGLRKNSALPLEGGRIQETTTKEIKWIKTNVPKTWERTAVGDFDGLVWYKTSFNVDENLLQDEKTYLSLGKLDDHDIVFLNSQQIGHASWKEWGRFYPVPDSLLKVGENELVVGVIDYGGEGGFSSNANDLFIDSFDKAGTNVRYPLPSKWKYFVDSYHPEITPVWLGGIVEPTILYNAMLSPLTKFQVKGFTWYQGERSKANPQGYDKLLKALINDWRNQWGGNELPFLFVQLPNYANETGQYPEGNWALLRHYQAQALELKNTGMAVTYDVGNPNDIHPLYKEPVGHRLAMAARKIAYEEDVVHSGPQLKEAIIQGNSIRISFETFGQVMIARDPYGYLKGFQIGFQKGADLQIVPVQAVIVGDDIIIDLKDLGAPDVVRYAWEDNPDANLYSQNGLPAPPFEHWFK